MQVNAVKPKMKFTLASLKGHGHLSEAIITQIKMEACGRHKEHVNMLEWLTKWYEFKSLSVIVMQTENFAIETQCKSAFTIIHISRHVL